MGLPILSRTVRDVLWSASSLGIRGASTIAALAVLARLLSPQDFGVATLATVLGNLVAYGAQMGLGPALVQAANPSRGAISAALRFSIAAAVLAAATFAAVAWVVAVRLSSEGALVGVTAYSLGVFGLVLTTVPEGLIQRNGWFKKLALIEGCAFLTGAFFVAVTLGFALRDYRAILIGSAVGHMSNAAALLILTRKEGWTAVPVWSEGRAFFRFGAWFSFSRVLNYASKEADNLIIGARAGVETVGFYSRAYVLASMPANYAGAAIERVFFPQLSEQFHSASRPIDTVLRGMELVLAVGVCLSVVLFLFAADLVSFVLGPAWGETVEPFAILSCALGWRLAYKFSDSYAKATGGVRARAWREVVVLLFLLAGCAIAAGYGVRALAIVVASSVLLNFMLAGLQATTHAGVSWTALARLHRRPAVSLLVFMPLALLIRHASRGHSVVIALTGVLLSVLVAVVVVIAVQKIDTHMKWR